MKIACFSSGADFDVLPPILRRIETDAELHCFCKYDDFDRALHICRYDVIIVYVRGRIGLEVVRIARSKNKSAPLIWITDEPDYGVVSYALHTAMALLMPVDETQLRQAFQRCREWKHDYEIYQKNSLRA